ncbi:polyisoprenoid-binding protein [Apibacter muscae]|uniref:YceI family protein n=1 Tax=Apibacter muscae TaxID=2509004 RepID=UPI0011AC6D58|nr:YceI family protein [Apibacter muscae]TWP23219.1 polyisoprenoid-binding protein [Apibacter muscae]
MKNILITITLVLTTILIPAQKLTLDPNHAKLKFDVTHMTISTIDGEFKKFWVDLDFNNPDFSDAKFTVTSDINSIDTGIEARDKHLKSADFFDAEKYPKLKFVSTSIIKEKKDNYELKGNLTLHGITKPVSLKVKYNGSILNPMTNLKTYGFTISGRFKRSDFEIGNNFPENIVSDYVNIYSNLEFTAN